MDPLTPPPSARHTVDQDGELFIWQPHPNVVVQTNHGTLSLPLARDAADFYLPLLRPGADLVVFDDFEQLTQYTREAREYLTRFTLDHLFAVTGIHFLLSSKFMALGVSAFKHDIGDERVRVYSDRSSFLQSYETAMQISRATS